MENTQENAVSSPEQVQAEPPVSPPPQSKFSPKMLLLLSVFLAVLVVGGIFAYGSYNSGQDVKGAWYKMGKQETVKKKPNTSAKTTTSKASNTPATGLEKDLQSFDLILSKLDSSLKDVDSGLNDKSGNLE